MPKITDIWKLGALGTPSPSIPDAPLTASWAHRLQRSLVALERVLRLIHLRVERATFAPDEVRRYTTDDFVVTDNNVPAPVPQLFFDVIVGVYRVHAQLVYSAGPGGTQYQLGGTATAASALYYTRNLSDATKAYVELTQQTSLLSPVVDNTSTDGVIEIQGVVSVATPGTLTVDFSQKNSDTDPCTVRALSWFEVCEIANPLTT